MSALVGQILNDFEEMAYRTRQAVDPHHDKFIAEVDLADQFRQSRATPGGAGCVFLDDEFVLRKSPPQLTEDRLMTLVATSMRPTEISRSAKSPLSWNGCMNAPHAAGRNGRLPP